MDYRNLVQARYSYRDYFDREVEEEKISYILEQARMAPSAANRQPWKIYLVSDPAVRNRLHESYPRDWFARAPLAVVFTGLSGTNWKRKDGMDYLLCDVTIIADYFILAATEVGLGTCYIAAFDEEIVREALSLPSDEIPLLMTPLGYPVPGSIRERSRKSMDEICVRI